MLGHFFFITSGCYFYAGMGDERRADLKPFDKCAPAIKVFCIDARYVTSNTAESVGKGRQGDEHSE